MSEPSDKAVDAAVRAIGVRSKVRDSAIDMLTAAHDPALDLDRSVCLRDVIEALELRYSSHSDKVVGSLDEHPADFILNKFGSK